MVLKNLFREKVVAIVKKIPKGKTMSYKEVAARAGHPGAARAVGAIMRANRDKSVPCHRVIHSDGSLGGYNGIRGEKEMLLKMEKKLNASRWGSGRGRRGSRSLT